MTSPNVIRCSLCHRPVRLLSQTIIQDDSSSRPYKRAKYEVVETTDQSIKLSSSQASKQSKKQSNKPVEPSNIPPNNESNVSLYLNHIELSHADLFDQLIDKLIKQTADPSSILQTITFEEIDRCILSITKPTDRSINHSTNQSTNQPTNQTTHQPNLASDTVSSLLQSIFNRRHDQYNISSNNQSSSQSINQSNNHKMKNESSANGHSSNPSLNLPSLRDETMNQSIAESLNQSSIFTAEGDPSIKLSQSIKLAEQLFDFKSSSHFSNNQSINQSINQLNGLPNKPYTIEQLTKQLEEQIVSTNKSNQLLEEINCRSIEAMKVKAEGWKAMDNVYSQIAQRRKRKAPNKPSTTQTTTQSNGDQSINQSDEIPFLHADIDLLLKRAELLNQTINGPINHPIPPSLKQSISHSSRQSLTHQSNNQAINSLIAHSISQPTLFKPIPLNRKPEPNLPVPMTQYISLLINQPNNQAQTPAHAQQYATYYEFALRLKVTEQWRNKWVAADKARDQSIKQTISQKAQSIQLKPASIDRSNIKNMINVDRLKLIKL